MHTLINSPKYIRKFSWNSKVNSEGYKLFLLWYISEFQKPIFAQKDPFLDGIELFRKYLARQVGCQKLKKIEFSRWTSKYLWHQFNLLKIIESVGAVFIFLSFLHSISVCCWFWGHFNPGLLFNPRFFNHKLDISSFNPKRLILNFRLRTF